MRSSGIRRCDDIIGGRGVAVGVGTFSRREQRVVRVVVQMLTRSVLFIVEEDRFVAVNHRRYFTSSISRRCRLVYVI